MTLLTVLALAAILYYAIPADHKALAAKIFGVAAVCCLIGFAFTPKNVFIAPQVGGFVQIPDRSFDLGEFK